jgi:hypothetical protein
MVSGYPYVHLSNRMRQSNKIIVAGAGKTILTWVLTW